jgi:hypothetical protein
MRATRRRGVTDATAHRLNVRLSADAYRRLSVHAVMEETTPGRLLERLISDHLRDWAVRSNRPARGALEDRLEADDSISPVEIAAA